MQEGDVVDTATDVREKVADPFPTLPITLEVPLGSDDATLVALAATAEGLHRDRLAVQGIELGLVVEGVDVARPPVHEEEDDALGLGGIMRSLGLQGIRTVSNGDIRSGLDLRGIQRHQAS